MPHSQNAWLRRVAWLSGLITLGFAIFGLVSILTVFIEESDPRCRSAEMRVLDNLAERLPTESISERGFERNVECTSDSVAYANSYTFLGVETVTSAVADKWNCVDVGQTKSSERVMRCDHEGSEFDLTIEAGEVWQDLRELRISLPEPAQ